MKYPTISIPSLTNDDEKSIHEIRFDIACKLKLTTKFYKEMGSLMIVDIYNNTEMAEYFRKNITNPFISDIINIELRYTASIIEAVCKKIYREKFAGGVYTEEVDKLLHQLTWEETLGYKDFIVAYDNHDDSPKMIYRQFLDTYYMRKLDDMCLTKRNY